MHLRRARLIPAHAGKTARSPYTHAATWAHPRSRGENTTLEVVECSGAGSSPLTRGKLHADTDLIHRDGLIPAHAGKTRDGLEWDLVGEAHPRSRGENLLANPSLIIGAGSSPLTRGKLTCIMSWSTCKGLIPAHAGKTLPDLRFYRADRSDLGKP